jgi:hypothetical protein
MKTKYSLTLFMLVGFLTACPVNSYAENIDPNEDGSQYAYGENVGWLNFEPNIPAPNVGATVSEEKLTGFIWAENIGWINLDPNDSDPNTGVSNDGAGNLSGLAWGENVGWLNFNPQVSGDPTHYGVTIDFEGNFDGYAWGENIGWINFNDADLFGYGILACKVNFADLGNFVDDWLLSGAGLPGDLSGNEEVDFVDYGMFAELWLTFCPDDWPLK